MLPPLHDIGLRLGIFNRFGVNLEKRIVVTSIRKLHLKIV